MLMLVVQKSKNKIEQVFLLNRNLLMVNLFLFDVFCGAMRCKAKKIPY